MSQDEATTVETLIAAATTEENKTLEQYLMQLAVSGIEANKRHTETTEGQEEINKQFLEFNEQQGELNKQNTKQFKQQGEINEKLTKQLNQQGAIIKQLQVDIEQVKACLYAMSPKDAREYLG